MGGFGAPAPQQGPPPACQALLVHRDETQKNAMAIRAAGQRKAPPDEACKLFKAFLASETKMIKGLEQNSQLCGVPGEVIKQLKTQHAQAEKTGKQVCDAAAMGPRPSGPSLSEALGSTPTAADPAEKKRGGTFDTLSGTALQR
jgi:hypothetical protein